MRHFLLVILLGLGLATHCNAELRIAIGAQETRSGAGPGGGLAAFNEDVAREICRRLNKICQVENVTFPEILAGVESGRFHLGFGNFLRTPERERRVAFSDSLWRSSSRLLAKPSAIRRYEQQQSQPPSLAGLSGTRVAVIVDSRQHAYLNGVSENRRLTLVPRQTMGELLGLLRDDQADFALVPVLSGYALIAKEPAGAYEFTGPPEIDNGLGGTVHIALPKNDDALRLKVNQALSALRSDGTYHRITRRHFDFNLE